MLMPIDPETHSIAPSHDHKLGILTPAMLQEMLRCQDQLMTNSFVEGTAWGWKYQDIEWQMVLMHQAGLGFEAAGFNWKRSSILYCSEKDPVDVLKLQQIAKNLWRYSLRYWMSLCDDDADGVADWIINTTHASNGLSVARANLTTTLMALTVWGSLQYWTDCFSEDYGSVWPAVRLMNLLGLTWNDMLDDCRTNAD